MAGDIFIEAREVEIVGLPTGALHLYLVFRDSSGDEYVIRSGPENGWLPWLGDMEIEANVPIEESSDDRGGDTPAERHSTPLDFAGLTDDEAWAIMVRYARMIEAEDYPYEVLDENSNAFVGAMLAAAGGDPLAMLPDGVDDDEAVGFDNYHDILADVPPPPDGTVYGTPGADRIAGIQIDQVIRPGTGNDSVYGGRGDDRVFGGAGDDLLAGEAGDDALRGGGGRDRLFGGAGNDRVTGGGDADLLDGGGGQNTLAGGAGADVFQFAEASTGTIRDFEDGADRLRIVGDVAASFDDLTISSFGPGGRHTRIVHEDIVIELRNVSRALIDASDLDLLLA